MDPIAQLPVAERADLFRETAVRMGGIHPLIPEKDYWVSWTLAELFSAAGMPSLLFKGGTSLAKVYKAIDRFSEDIDLALDRAQLGFSGADDPLGAPSASKATKLVDGLDAERKRRVNKVIAPLLETSAEELDAGATVKIIEDGHSIALHYPPALTEEEYVGFGYIAPFVLLEIGARSDHDPVESHVVNSYAAEQFPDFAGSPVTMRVLAAERTFWEKATILHVEGNRPANNRRSWGRQSRHCYDLYEMIRRGIGDKALGRLDLLEAVARHKAVFFRAAWANYESARPGTFVLRPRGQYADVLARDYGAMKQMIFGEVPSWSNIVASLAQYEERLARLAHATEQGMRRGG